MSIDRAAPSGPVDAKCPPGAYRHADGRLLSTLDGLPYRSPARPKPHVWGMEAFGDSLYQRPFVKHLERPVIRTLWPQVYSDIPGVRFVEGGRLRTSVHNGEIAKREGFVFEPGNAFTNWQHIGYSDPECIADGICKTFRKQFAARLGVSDEPVYDLPPLPPAPDVGAKGRPIAVLRPVTLRREWQAEARAPAPEYVAQAAKILRAAGYYTVSVAFLQQGEEWLVKPGPRVDAAFDKGELSMWQIAALVKQAAVCVSGVGFMLPLCASAHTPLFTILGGFGGINSPESITDPAMDSALFGWGIPDRYCRCTDRQHKGCDKSIANFDILFTGWLREKNLCS